MSYSAELDIKKIIGWLAGSIALALVILLPSGYYYSSYQYLLENTGFKAESIARDLSRFVFEHPDTWWLQEHRIDAIINTDLSNSQNRIILTSSAGQQLYNNQVNTVPPILSVNAAVTDVHQQVATLTLQTSRHDLIQQTVIVFFISLSFGAMVFLVLYILPMRALMSTLSRLDDSQKNLVREIENKEKALEDAQRLGRKLHDMAMHDSLTGLPNRSLFQERLTQALLTAERHTSAIAVIMLDLNRFKEVNDTLGHHVGDALLVEVAGRLQSSLRKSDTIARLGGDEFALIVHVNKASDGEIVCNTILQTIKQPMEISEFQLSINIGGSCGIAVYPQHGDNPAVLLQKADIAMYSAKKSSSNIAVYDSELDTNTPERLRLVHQLSDAIINGELFLVYQPKLDIQSQQVVGVEALIRWDHPEDGMISPGLFIPWAEETEIIHPLTEWVIDTALEQQQQWKHMGIQLDVSINISGKNLRDNNFHRKVDIAIQKWHSDANAVILEVTESAMIDNTTDAKYILQQLSEGGVRLSIDDFGTGHASLMQLKNFPFDELKIDRSFINDMMSDNNDTAIVRSAIALAKSLHMKTVAEGIENQDILNTLKDMGCDIAQGFYLCQPLSNDELTRWMRSQSATENIR